MVTAHITFHYARMLIRSEASVLASENRGHLLSSQSLSNTFAYTLHGHLPIKAVMKWTFNLASLSHAREVDLSLVKSTDSPTIILRVGVPDSHKLDTQSMVPHDYWGMFL